ncbi:hypothetical protein GGX14DRAFT_617546 [Mycena pura]|uniref:Transforming growth factor beta regulator 1 n=1 Tax=Mycena pura TaxID=153505 RepID=A0AAD6VIB0_9AGAR|nr:hypothetical protein GGX14DRAFT_617546 [Mycena pura]
MSGRDAPATSSTAPAVLAASASSSGVTPPPRTREDVQEKYRKLKRRFFELEEKHKETSTELQRSGERNSKMQEERNLLLERIMELETHPSFVPPSSNGAYSTSPGPSGSTSSHLETLHDAPAEDDADADAEIDPVLTAQSEETAVRRSPRRPRNGKDKDAVGDDDPAVDSALPPADPLSSTDTRLRIRPEGSSADPTVSPSHTAHPRSISPESGGIPADDENDVSGDYSPPQKGTKRTRDNVDNNGDIGTPEAKAPRRSSRRSAAATISTSASASRTKPTKSTRSKGAPAASFPHFDAEDGPSQTLPISESSAPDSAATSSATTSAAPSAILNGHSPQTEAVASSSSSTPAAMRSGSLSYNPYSFLAPAAGAMPPGYPYGNPYAYYLTGPLPGANMPWAPPLKLPMEAPRPAKPKRLKAHTVTSRSYSIPMVPRDKKGKPMLPLNVGIMTVINLGDVCMREHFHTERYIFPVGYEVTRRYLSTVDRNTEVVYHCTILDGGDGPKFQIIPSDVPDRPVIAGTATGAWSSIVKQANVIRQRQHSNSVSGPDFFGLGQNTIKHLIQELPNADRLRDYVWQHFVEGGPLGGRHAAVIPALPEEYNSATPIGPYYPPRIPPRDEDGPRVSHYPPHIMAQAPGSPKGQEHSPQPQQQEYEEAGRQVMPPGHAHGVGNNYYLPHTQQQPGDGSDENGHASGSFASIMNAFPTQSHDAINGSGGGVKGSAS